MSKNSKTTTKNHKTHSFSKAARVFAIIQLSIIFSILCWNLSKPFMESSFEIKKMTQLYQSITNQQNEAFFSELPIKTQKQVHTTYTKLIEMQERSFLNKVFDSLNITFLTPSPFKLAWIFLALIVSIMALKGSPKIAQAVWFLPLLTCIYGIENLLFAKPPLISEEEKLYPKESHLISQYLNEPLSKNIFEQQEQLKKTWQYYLTDHWLPEQDQKNITDKEIKTKKAKFFFNIAKLESYKKDFLKKQQSYSTSSSTKEPLFFLTIYCIWNLTFAYVLFKASKQSHLDFPCSSF